MSDLIDPTELSPGEIPDIPAGPFTEQLDKWLTSAVRWSVREEAYGLPDWPRPEDETPTEKRAAYQPWFYRLVNFLWYGSTAGLLVRIAQLAPEHVDAIARELDEWIDAGDFYPEWVWEWAEKRGLDPHALTDQVREELKEQAAEDAQPAPLREPLKTALAAVWEADQAVAATGVHTPQLEILDVLQTQHTVTVAALDQALELLGVRR